MDRLGMVAAVTAVLVGGLGVEPAEGARTLRQGMSGEDIRQLQGKLTACGELVSADALFGGDTRQAVERFERSHQLTIDGIADAVVLRALDSCRGEIATGGTGVVNSALNRGQRDEGTSGSAGGRP